MAISIAIWFEIASCFFVCITSSCNCCFCAGISVFLFWSFSLHFIPCPCEDIYCCILFLVYSMLCATLFISALHVCFLYYISYICFPLFSVYPSTILHSHSDLFLLHSSPSSLRFSHLSPLLILLHPCSCPDLSRLVSLHMCACSLLFAHSLYHCSPYLLTWSSRLLCAFVSQAVRCLCTQYTCLFSCFDFCDTVLSLL